MKLDRSFFKQQRKCNEDKLCNGFTHVSSKKVQEKVSSGRLLDAMIGDFLRTNPKYKMSKYAADHVSKIKTKLFPILFELHRPNSVI